MPKLTKKQQSKIGRRSRRKGKAFERWCARYFFKWFDGTWETTRNSGRTDLEGDIYRVDAPLMEFVVECKDDKRYNVNAMTKPTEAFRALVRKYRRRKTNLGWSYSLLLVVKNQSGKWISLLSNRHDLNGILVDRSVSAIVSEGIYFFKLDQALFQLRKILQEEHKIYMEQVARRAGVETKGVDRPISDGQS